MKTLKKLIFVLILACLYSCSSDTPRESVPYFRFTESDRQKIINHDYQQGQTITYKNQDGVFLHFEILEVADDKVNQYSPSTFSGGGGLLESSYDRKAIRFSVSENDGITEGEQGTYLFTKKNDQLTIAFNLPMWNLTNAIMAEEQYVTNIVIDLSAYSIGQRTVDGHLFSKVLTINSATENVPVNAVGALPNNVHKIFYDLEFGIIEFHDLDGNTWTVQYPD